MLVMLWIKGELKSMFIKLWKSFIYWYFLIFPERYLFGPEHHGHHALGLRGLGAFIDENGAELHLCQARVTRTHTCATDHICVLRKNREWDVCRPLSWGWHDGSCHVRGVTGHAFILKHFGTGFPVSARMCTEWKQHCFNNCMCWTFANASDTIMEGKKCIIHVVLNIYILAYVLYYTLQTNSNK